MLFYRDPHTPLQEMIPETAEPVPLPHGSATVKTETLAGEECPDKTTKTLGPVVNGDDPNRASRKPESSESQPIPEEALMERVERMNLDMKETGEETHGGARRGILRRRDQVRAGKEDSPTPKGRGRGRGRGKGRGRGHSRGRSQKKAEKEPCVRQRKRASRPKADQEGGDAPAAASSRKSRKSSETPAEPKAPAARSRKPRKSSETPAPAESKASEPPSRKRKSSKAPEPAEGGEAENVTPVRKQSARRQKSVPAASSTELSNPTPPKVSGVSESEKERLKKAICLFKHSTVVAYWSRGAAGLKCKKPDGTSCQAGDFCS